MPVPSDTAPCNVQPHYHSEMMGDERVSDEGDTIAIAPLKIKIELLLPCYNMKKKRARFRCWRP